MSANAANAQEALRVVQESYPWVLQAKHPESDVWMDIGRPIKGRTKAYRILNEKKAAVRGKHEFRVLPKNEADKYKEGLNTGRKRKPLSKRPLPLLALPENL